MKKILLTLTGLLFSAQALALPQPTDLLITALMTENAEFKQLLIDKSGDGQRISGYDTVSVERLELNPEIIEACNVYSRSASALKVTFASVDNEQDDVYVFATNMGPEGLHFCN